MASRTSRRRSASPLASILPEGIRAPRPGETPEQARERGRGEFMALQASPFFRVWQCAGVDEILSTLYERMVVPRGA